MNLSHPMTAIASPLTSRVIEVLAGTSRPLTGREIHRLAGAGSKTGVLKVLTRLQEHGVVDLEQRSAASYFVANREHLAWPAIETLVRLRSELFRLLSSSIDSWELRPIHASAFGSFARGDGDERSDVDILVVRDPIGDLAEQQWERQLDGLRTAVRRGTGNRCQTYAIDTVTLRRQVAVNDPLVDSWIRDEIVIAGTSITELIGSMS